MFADISKLGKGDGKDFRLEIYANRQTFPVLRADTSKCTDCQVIIGNWLLTR